jgi:hypothetical protein
MVGELEPLPVLAAVVKAAVPIIFDTLRIIGLDGMQDLAGFG